MNFKSDAFSMNMQIPTTGEPWISGQMPWSNTVYPGVMQFTAVPDGTVHKNKRKLIPHNIEELPPPKQLITEEKMTATLNSLHISHDFIAHNSNIATEIEAKIFASPNKPNEEVMDSETELECYSLYTSKDLEEKLKRAKHITICEQFKNINSDELIIPKALLEHYEKPCKALVIWQPPPKFQSLILSNETNNKQLDHEKNENDNSSNKNFENVTMDTDLC